MSPPQSERDRLFSEMYAREYVDVLRFVRRRSDPESAADLVHEAFLVAWRRFDSLPAGRESSRAWLFAIARNCILNGRRGRDRHAALVLRVASDIDTDGTGFEDDVISRLDLLAAWRRLNPQQQEAIALTAWEGLDSVRAAQVLGITAVTFRLRLHRARTALRALHTPSNAQPTSGTPALEKS